jgi:hypothetical protein
VNVAHHDFELVDVREKAPPSGFGDAHDRRRAAAAGHAFGRDDPDFGEGVQVTVEVAVGQAARVLQIGEAHPVGIRDQTGAHREPASLVKDPLEPAVGERRPVVAHPSIPARNTSAPIAI